MQPASQASTLDIAVISQMYACTYVSIFVIGEGCREFTIIDIACTVVADGLFWVHGTSYASAADRVSGYADRVDGH